MVKIIWKFFVVHILCCSLLLTSSLALTPEEAQKQVDEAQAKANAASIEATNTVNQNTGVTKDALTSGDVHRVTTEQVNMAAANVPTAHKISAEAQRQLDIAKADLAEKNEVLADAQKGLNRVTIKEKEAALATAQTLCPGYSPGSAGEDGQRYDDIGSCSSATSRNAIIKATDELKVAKTPVYDRNAINKASQEVKAAEKTLIAAGHEAQYGLQTKAGAEALRAAAKEIDDSITDEFKKDAAGNTKADGIMNLIKKSTTNTTLKEQYKGLGQYNAQLQQDIVMLILGQVTSRLNNCTSVPDINLGIGAGQAFIVGEVAEYAQAQFLKGKLEKALADRQYKEWEKQLDTFRTLRTEYQQVLASANTKQKFRGLSLTAFKNAAALAAAEAVENETWQVACDNENTNKVSRGSNQGGDNMLMYLALAAAAWKIAYCGGCAAAIAFMGLYAKSQSDKNSCESGGSASEQRIVDRKLMCDTLGTEDMFTPANEPTITASKTIRDRCLADGAAVSAGAGNGCKGYSSNGAGPYSACDKATDAYKRNMSGCPATVLTAGKVATLETSGVASEEGREFVRKASEKVSRTVDLRMASPRHRIIVWSAFGELANNSVIVNKDMIIAIEGQLAKIQRIIDDLEKYANGQILAKGSDVQGIGVKAAVIDANEALQLNFANTTACITGSTGTCKAPSDTIKLNAGFDNLPLDLQASTAKVAAGLDAINNTKSLNSGDISTVANASHELTAIKGALLKKQKQLQLLAKNSKFTDDLDKESNLFAGNLKSGISKEAKNSGYKIAGEGSEGKAGLFGSGGMDGLGVNGLKDQSDATKKDKSNAYGIGSLGGSGFGSGSTSSASSGAKASGEDEASKQLSEAAARAKEEDSRRLAEAIEARNKTNKDKYASSDELSIFEKVTNAYIRNYDKVLTKKKDKDITEQKR